MTIQKKTKRNKQSFWVKVSQFCNGGWSVFLQSALHYGFHATSGLQQLPTEHNYQLVTKIIKFFFPQRVPPAFF